MSVVFPVGVLAETTSRSCTDKDTPTSFLYNLVKMSVRQSPGVAFCKAPSELALRPGTPQIHSPRAFLARQSWYHSDPDAERSRNSSRVPEGFRNHSGGKPPVHLETTYENHRSKRWRTAPH